MVDLTLPGLPTRVVKKPTASTNQNYTNPPQEIHQTFGSTDAGGTTLREIYSWYLQTKGKNGKILTQNLALTIMI
jgi:hypothetical protein